MFQTQTVVLTVRPMDQDLARRRALGGGTLLCLDVPAGLEFVCDCKIWEGSRQRRRFLLPGGTASRRMRAGWVRKSAPHAKHVSIRIPPGMHLFAWGAGHGMRYATIYDVQPAQVVVKKWDPLLEDFAQAPFEPDEVRLRRLSLRGSGAASALGRVLPRPAERAARAQDHHCRG